MDLSELCFQPLLTLGSLFSRKEVSPVEVVLAHLERIERLDPILKAYITVLPERAIEEARRAEREIASGRYRGPLHGIPIGHKDIYETRGVRTTAHSRVLANNVPASDATVVRRLSMAGAVTIGKLNTYEFACGDTALFGTPRNPWDIMRTTGGSSAGSASGVAAGLCSGATGTDTGGSIRAPAAYCGVVGLKPTYGRVSRFGVIPLAWSLDHMGPIARTAEDCAALLEAMSGHDKRDPTSSRRQLRGLLAKIGGGDPAAQPRLDGVRIGVPESFQQYVADDEVRRTVAAAIERLRELGASTVPVDLPSATWTDTAWEGTGYPETFLVHLRWLREDVHRYAPMTRRRILIGACLTAVDQLKAQRLRRRIGREYSEALATADVLAWPTTYRVAPGLDEPSLPPGLQTRLTSLVGAPSVSVPCGFTSAGMPIGLLLNGRLFDEVGILRVACAYGRATRWHERRPRLEDAASAAPVPARGDPPLAVPLERVAGLRDEVLMALRDQGVTLLEEDIDPLTATLAAFREALDSADSITGSEMEPAAYAVLKN